MARRRRRTACRRENQRFAVRCRTPRSSLARAAPHSEASQQATTGKPSVCSEPTWRFMAWAIGSRQAGQFRQLSRQLRPRARRRDHFGAGAGGANQPLAVRHSGAATAGWHCLAAVAATHAQTRRGPSRQTCRPLKKKRRGSFGPPLRPLSTRRWLT